MRASEALRKPGDAARRESDGAVAVRRLDVTAEGDALSGSCVFMQPKRQPDYYTHVNSIAGDDWQPLVTAERVEELEEENQRLEKQVGDINCEAEFHATQAEEIKDIIMGGFLIDEPGACDETYGTPLIAMVREASDAYNGLRKRHSQLRADRERLASQIATLTAELEKARSGEAWVGNEIWNDCRLPTAPLPPAEPTPTPAPAKPECSMNSDYVNWVANNRYELTSIGAAALVSLLRDPELAAAIDVSSCRLPTAPLPPAEPTPTPAPAKPEWQEALVAWAREVAYQIATVRPTSEVEPLMVLSRELSAALEQE